MELRKNENGVKGLSKVNHNHLIKFLFIEKYFLSDPELNLKLDMSYLSYKEKYEEAIRRSVVIHKKLIKILLETGGSQDETMFVN